MCAGRCIAGVRNEFQCSETKLLLWFACLSPCSRSCSSSRERKITTFDHGKILSCPAQLFSQLTIELVKRNFFEWLRQDQFTSFQDITNWYFMNSGQDYKVLLFSSWHQKSCFMCVLTLCEWLIIRFDLKTNSKQQLFYKIFCIKSNHKNCSKTQIFTAFQ